MPIRSAIRSILFFFILMSTVSCAVLTKRVKRSSDITYSTAYTSPASARNKLDIYAPRKNKNPRNVMIFVHGGNWNAGDKGKYIFFGNRFARKNIVTVLLNYRLSPGANYNDMAIDVAKAVEWTKNNIHHYGGNSEKIFIAGHSAGGHLAALVTVKDEYFDSLGVESPIKGTILIDAAGLDMYSYLKDDASDGGTKYLNTFTKSQDAWKDASPIYHLKAEMPPFLIYRGGKTYPGIISSNEAFVQELQSHQPVNYKVQKLLGHINMMVQFIYTLNPRYREIIRFMDNPDENPFRRN